MPTPRPTLQEIKERIYVRILNETSLTAGLESSAIGVLVNIMAAEIDSQWAYIDELTTQSSLTTATGGSLDDMGLMFGVPRKVESKATTTGGTPSIRFTNLGGTSLSIPVGTRVYKDSDPSIAFFTIEGATLAGGASVDVHATAAQPGQAFNVAIGDINRHSAPTTALSVTNILPIQNGAARESDTSYRERILQDLLRRNSLTVPNTTALLRTIDGVKDAMLINLARGTGTFDVIITPYHSSQTESVVEECRALLSDTTNAGIDFVVKAPKIRQLDLTLTLRFNPSASNKELDRQLIRSIINARVGNLPVENGTGNGSLFLSQLRSVAAAASPAIIDAAIVGALDEIPLTIDGEVKIGLGDRIELRSLVIR